MSFRWAFVRAAALAGLFLLGPLVLPGVPAGAEKPLVIGVGRDFYEGSDSRTYLHGSTNTWEALTYLDADMNAAPWLAESWRSDPDGRVWTFILRSGVRFHDGSALTARDAAACIDRIRSHPQYDPAGNCREIASVTAEGDLGLVFRLTSPVPDFPKRIAYYSSPVIRPGGFGPDGRIMTFTATGPYRVERVLPGSEIRLSAFDQYWGSPPAFQQVIFRQIPDAQTRIMALLSGDIDAVADVGGILPQQADLIRSNPTLALKQVEVATTHILLFNCGRPPFSHAGTRAWLSGALDRENLVAAFAGGAGRVAFDPYTRLCAAYAFGLIQPEPRPFPADGASAENQPVLLLHGGTLDRWPYADIAQVVQQILLAQGIHARIEIREAGGYKAAVQAGDFVLAIQPYTLMTGDPDFFYAYFIQSGAPRNTGYRNPAADALILAARREMDPVRRTAAYRELSEILDRDLPLLPLYHDVSLYACRSSMGDFTMDHLFRPILTRCRP